MIQWRDCHGTGSTETDIGRIFPPGGDRRDARNAPEQGARPQARTEQARLSRRAARAGDGRARGRGGIFAEALCGQRTAAARADRAAAGTRAGASGAAIQPRTRRAGDARSARRGTGRRTGCGNAGGTRGGCARRRSYRTGRRHPGYACGRIAFHRNGRHTDARPRALQRTRHPHRPRDEHGHRRKGPGREDLSGLDDKSDDGPRRLRANHRLGRDIHHDAGDHRPALPLGCDDGGLRQRRGGQHDRPWSTAPCCPPARRPPRLSRRPSRAAPKALSP